MIIILVGESGSGKTTLLKEFLQHTNGFTKTITCTTRDPRSCETQGIDYNFLSIEAFDILRKQNKFIEWTQYNDHYYGTLLSSLNSNQITIMTPSGAEATAMLSKNPVVTVYIKTSERARLIKLLQRGDNIDLAYKRVLTDRTVFAGYSDKADVVLDNESFQKNPTKLCDELITAINIYRNLE